MNRHTLEDILREGKVATADGDAVPLHSHIPPLECQILRQWIRNHRPRRILEIGLAYGVSSLAICDALDWEQEIVYHIVDPYQHSQWRGVGLLNLERAGYAPAISFHEETSQTALPKLLRSNLRFDCVFIDGSHEKSDVLLDVQHSHALLNPGGLILLDDIQIPGVQAAVEHLTTTLGYEPAPIPEPFQKSIPVRVRRLNGVPESRVIALCKV